MQSLIIETSCNRSCLILATEGHPIAIRHLNGGSELSKRLGKEVQDLLQQSPSFHADFVAIGTGPGSFTGIRVGAAMAQALAFGWRVPLVHYCSLEAFLPPQMGMFAILVDARMGGIYCLNGERTPTEIHFEEPHLLSIPEVLKLDCLLASPFPADIQKRLASDHPIQEVEIDADFLSAECTRLAQIKQISPLEPLPLTYLSVMPAPAISQKFTPENSH